MWLAGPFPVRVLARAFSSANPETKLMSDYSQTIAFKLSSDLRRLLDEAADQEMTNVSAYIRQAVAAKLKRDGWKLGKEAR